MNIQLHTDILSSPAFLGLSSNDTESMTAVGEETELCRDLGWIVVTLLPLLPETTGLASLLPVRSLLLLLVLRLILLPVDLTGLAGFT